ncbi:MAG: hypothetical protein HKN17_09775 [Rhodothermales bacterium]|nr:hypothetical protein [Rhodothermales bacterium]
MKNFDDNHGHDHLSRALRSMAETERDRSVRPMIADRIMRTLDRSRPTAWTPLDIMAGQLLTWFRPVVAAGVLLIILLAGYNLVSSIEGDTATDRLLGLPSVTVASVYDMDLALEDH